MVKRSIEQNLRTKNFEARNGNFETNAVVKNQGTKQRGQRSLGDCWQWKANGQCSKGDNCSFRRDKEKRAKSTQQNRSFPLGLLPPVGKWLDCLARIISKELAPLHSVKNGILRSACSTSQSENGCKFGDKCSYVHRQVDEQSSKKSEKNGGRIAVAFLKNARQVGCVSQNMEPPKYSSILRKSSTISKPIQRCSIHENRIAFCQHSRHQMVAWSLGVICRDDPHQRNPNAPKFEDRSQEETEWQERCAREAAWKLAKHILKLKEHTKQHPSHLRRIGVYLRHQQLNYRKENLLLTPVRRCT